ncbi:MAG: FAD-dependent oxidoreductase, partial [Candidatus Promineifilaceae bacterium]
GMMMKMETEVLVIGGGATGTAVLRDLAMRGVEAVLVERGNLSDGTTGNFHGLLHSGGRYAVKDRAAAEECIRENTILRSIAPQAIEDTGGFFVALDDVDEAYLPRLVESCEAVGIPTEVLDGSEALRLEPCLSPSVRQAVTVPDASVDSWDLCVGNIASAREYGARVLLYTPVIEILRENGRKDGGRVTGVRATDLKSNEEVVIHAEYVVNATGPWSHKVARLARIDVPMVLSAGTMIVLDSRPVKRVINRCRKSADGDIIVPVGTTIVLGTTSVEVQDPDNFASQEWEVDKILDEAIQMLPMIETMGLQRCYAGVRPLYEPPQAAGEEDGREVSRAFYVLDHEKVDGVAGFLTITGGKLTTSRLMAEKTADLVCEKIGVQATCRTHLEMLPTATPE